MYEELEELKRENQQKVHSLENYLIQLESVTYDNKDLFEKLDTKVKRVNHLQNYLKNIQDAIKAKGSKMYSLLCRKQQQNADCQAQISELQSDINKITRKLEEKEYISNNLSSTCKQMIQTKSKKFENVRTMKKEIMEITDRIEEARHIIVDLKKKNTRREKDVNKLSEKADELMKKYTELKDKAVQASHDYLDNSKEFNMAIGSRLLSYQLHRYHMKHMTQQMATIKSFCEFDDISTRAVRNLVRVYAAKCRTTTRDAFVKWQASTLKPTQTSRLTSQLGESISQQQKFYNEILVNGEKKRKQFRHSILEQSARDRIRKVFVSMTLRDQKRMFDQWRDICNDQNNKA